MSLPPLPPPGAPTPDPLSAPSPIGGSPVDGGAGTRRRVLLFVSVAVVLLLVGVAAGLLVASDEPEEARVEVTVPDDTSVDAPSTTEVDDAPTTTEDEAAVDGIDAEIAAAVEELSAFVAEERGRPFKEPVVVELATEGEFQERLLEDFEEDEQDLRDLGRILRALGFVDPDVDLVQSLRSLLEAGVVGFYDPETDELVVRGSSVSAYVRITIVHELVHAYDDQWFDLDRPELDDVDDETSFGFGALVEGNARRVENEYRATLSEEEAEEALDEEMSFGAGTDLSDVPLVLIELLIAPYELGAPLVELLADEGGEERIDEAFEEPPRTSSAVMHPERYLSGWEEVAVEAPPVPEGAKSFDEGVFGELVLSLLLRDRGRHPRRPRRGEAWAGDWYVSWDEGDRTCLRVDVATFGSRRDRSELEDALGAWVDEHDDADVREVGDLLRLTACG